MTVLNPYHITVDGLSLGTYAHQIEVVRGVDVLTDRRRVPLQPAFRHGTPVTADWYFDEKTLPLQITVMPWDEDGDSVHSAGMQGTLRDNLDALLTIFGKRSLIDVRRFVPTEDESPDDGLLELQAYATVGKGSVIDGGPALRQLRVDLILPYPFWHELPQITRVGATSHDFTTGGTAPISDMVLILFGDGTVTDNHGAEFEISGATGAVTVDVGKREVYQGGSLAMALFELRGREDWMEWPAQTEIELDSTVSTSVAYFNARH